ncbi:serine hydrolase domain-containing protein [Marinihelvus fidelis]|nr:serine hydrolase domain-containing protein [Marinihelvus fidelis]
MGRRFLACVALTLCLLAPVVAQARDLSHTARAEAVASAFFEQSGSPGLAVSVGLNGQLAWSAGYGMADLEQGVSVDPATTKFRIGSVIKPMTAVAIAQLVEAGKIDLDAPVQAYVPAFPLKSAPVTTRGLLAHLAGIRHYAGDEFMLRERYDTVDAGLAIFMNDPLVNAPGSAYVYSSYGYNLLGAVIEGASGQDYLAYMRDHVTGPMGMNDTEPDWLAPIIAGRGRYYVQRDGEIFNAPEVDNSYKWASGGYVGTSEDLVRFGLAMLHRPGLSEQTLDTFWTEQSTTGGEPTGYGLGWRVTRDDAGTLWIGHGGGSVGGTTTFWFQPETGFVLAAISNLSQFDFGTLPAELSAAFTETMPDP